MTVIEIESLAYGGDGVGHLEDGRAAFVRGSCPGDRVKIAVAESHDRFVRADVEEVLTPSPDRVEPPCPYFGACGGCQWQHVSYERQLAAKREAVVEALRRIGKVAAVEDLVLPARQSKDQYGYRNKIELVVDPAQPRITLGYHRIGSGEVVGVDRCLLLPKRFQSAPKALSGALRYLAGESDLGITRVGIRVARNTRDLEIALWTPPGAFPRAAAARVLSQALPLTSLVRVLHADEGARSTVKKVEVLSGKGLWRERLAEFGYAVSAPSFFQTNTHVAEALVALVLADLEPDGTDRVLDLYAGVGTFTLPLALRAGEVAAVEAAGSAVRDLRRNLESNALGADVVGGDAGREISGLGRFDLVVVDPPRSGLGADVLAALGRSRPRVLSYVSCDPATLARDASRLRDLSYDLKSATPIDLFPQTFHVETVARFEPRG